MALCVILPKLHAYRRGFDATKNMCFLMKDNELVQKHNEIWGKVSNTVQKQFDSEPVYNGNYLKTKIKSYDKMPKRGSHCICLSVVLN